MKRQISPSNTYTDKLLKLVPAEFVSFYLAVSQVVPRDSDLRQEVLISTTVLFLLLIPIYLTKVQGVTDRRQIALTMTTFFVWTYSLGDAYINGGSWITYDIYRPEIGAAALLVCTGLLPVLTQSDR